MLDIGHMDVVKDLVGKDCQALSKECPRKILVRKTKSNETPNMEVQLGWRPSSIRFIFNLRALR